MKIYALLIYSATGEIPRTLRLLYLGSCDEITKSFDEGALAEVKREVKELASKIKSAIQSETFVPSESRLCDYCNFKEKCPIFSSNKKTAPNSL